VVVESTGVDLVAVPVLESAAAGPVAAELAGRR
jgi:hypothetical protein